MVALHPPPSILAAPPAATRSPAAGRAARRLWWALGALMAMRLLAMAWFPLMDTTEARYAEIARRMLDTRDWITPWHDDGVPFWAKPPLSFWLTTASMRLLGVGEFAARLPHFICMLAVAWNGWRLAAARDDTPALPAAGLLLGSALGLAAAGAVMTDAALVWGTSLAMRGLWLALNGPPEHAARERRLLAAGLVIGLLAKGPLALVLVALPVGAWALACGQLGRLRTALPWRAGSLAVLAGAGWWYAAAELKTPGFLAYFIVGEHWHRFVTPGWSGDRYGFAHAFPAGTIWLFAVVATLPWPLLLLASRRRDAPPPARCDDAARSWRTYLACWALAPLVFFSAARNIILPYVLPALPAAALLAAGWLARRVGDARAHDRVAAGVALAALGLAALLVAGALSRDGGLPGAASSRAVVREWEARRHVGEPLVFVTERLYSANFYSGGRARFADSAPDAARLLAPGGGFAVLRRGDSAAAAQFACVTRRTELGGFELLHLPSHRDAATACPRHAQGPDVDTSRPGDATVADHPLPGGLP